MVKYAWISLNRMYADVWSRYCSPIHVDAEELFEETADPDAASRCDVAQVEKQMMENTINAPEVRLPHIK